MTQAPTRPPNAPPTALGDGGPPPAADPLALLNELARVATQDFALRPMLQRITDTLASRLGIELVSLVRVDRASSSFVCEALTSSLPTEVHVGYTRELGSGVVGRVAESGRPLLLDDVGDFAGYVETLGGVVSELCLPITHSGKVVALLNLESPRPAAFHGQLALFSAVAEQVSGAIASARLFDETRRRAFFLEVVSEVSHTALAGGELREVLGRLARYIQERFHLTLAAIVVSNESGSEWEQRAIALRPGLTMPPRKRWPVSAGIVGRAIRTGEPQLVLDTANDPDFFGLDEKITCEYAVPLRFQGRVLGAFNIEGEDRAVMNEENLALFRTIAEQIVGRIELALVNQKLQEANRELEALARRDALTGVANRRQFDEALEAEWRRARRARSPIALAIADVDHFKAYNDACGHQAGDACLQSVAQTLVTVAHRAGDLVARYGGEEFAILLPGLDGEQARALAEAMRRAVEQRALPHPSSPVGKVVTASLGVCSLVPLRGDTASTLVHETDLALYRAKASGRNRVARSGSS
ncbi:MAG: diguanylate cyclase [Thermoanaerobaculia bacterium]|nr:diguanylate cyclase [Thermoanaerobaculia bacterium]MBP9823250.1 diguanylate cyclase [Thermoanaerobaculia bacterium]